MICLAAVAIAISPEEHWRSTVCAPTLTGSPAGWDSFSVPPGCWRTLHNTGDGEAMLAVMTAGDGRKRIDWSPEVRADAAAAGFAHDASGFVAPKRFVDRAQA